MNYRLDTDSEVFCYLDEFYPLSNFSAFRLKWRGIDFDTSEHAYHWEKFSKPDGVWIEDNSDIKRQIQDQIFNARSAHEAFQIAQRNKKFRRHGWDELKRDIMKDILWCKLSQHEYVHKKLLETGKRTIIEDSWRDSYWGWGPDKRGENMLGKLWMEIRTQVERGY